MGSDGREQWLKGWGTAIDRHAQAVGLDGLIPSERLIHALWLMSCSMRSTGDLVAARERDPRFLADGLAAARALDLPEAVAAFSQSAGWFEAHFFEIFAALCHELRSL
ncbi:hypothetical protein [Novosphingobium terrae]|uniref:hypothetical protein n=1 Tax=Novosphingobium terrae TaxID=2726189 RepID=UPI00197E23DD|nr:hypothetical protein [Novosphingobium terrae]